MQEIIITFITGIIAALGALVTRYVVPWIRERTTAEQRAAAVSVIETLVRAAEQTIKSRGFDGKACKIWVLDHAELLGLSTADEEIDAIIEAAVLELRMAQAEVTAVNKPFGETAAYEQE
jgi:hypothetical protein